MADILPKDLPAATTPLDVDNDVIIVEQPAGVRKTTPSQIALDSLPIATQGDAEVGTDNSKRMTPLLTKQSIASEVGATVASFAQGQLADTAVQPARTITAGTGLTGGGTLAANRSIALNSSSIASLLLADSAVQPADLATVATTGSYSDLTDVPPIPQGTVTSVGLSLPTGLSVAGSPVVGAGTLTGAWESGYQAYTTAEASKLSGVSAGATANQTNAFLLARANHTGTQPASTITGLSDVATSGDYGDLSGRPALGTAAAQDVGAFATSGQGSLADSAVQPADLATVATTGSYNDLTDKPALGTAASSNVGDFATAAQGGLADTAVQPARTIAAGSGLSGGGSLAADRTISLSAASIASLSLADNSVQPADLGELATKDTVTVADIAATGTPGSETFLRGDGVWAPGGSGGGGGQVDSVTEGDGISVDATNPISPTVSISSAVSGEISANTAARHTHSNKAVLDGTTASFTTALQTKLNGVAAGATANTGTVTSVAMAVPTGFGVTGAITTSGTFTLTYATGYQGYTTVEANKLSGIQAGAQVNPGVATTSANGLMASADKTKLNGIATGATANTGTVTSVGLVTPTGFNNTGAITTSGNITIGYASGYQGYTTAEASKLGGLIETAVSYAPQVLTTEQQEQARENIGVLPRTKARITFHKPSTMTYEKVEISGGADTLSKHLGSGGITGSMTLREFARESGRRVVLNCDASESYSESLQIIGGVAYNDFTSESHTQEAVIMKNDGKLYPVYMSDGKTAQDYVDEGAIWSAGHRKLLIVDGTKTNLGSHADYNTVVSARTILGQRANGDLLMFFVEGKTSDYGITYLAAQDLALAEGCEIAMNLDGGGSTQAWWGGSYYAHHSSDTSERGTIGYLSVNVDEINEFDTGNVVVPVESGVTRIDPEIPEIVVRQVGAAVYMQYAATVALPANTSVTVTSNFPVRFSPDTSGYMRGFLQGANGALVPIIVGGSNPHLIHFRAPVTATYGIGQTSHPSKWSGLPFK